MTAPFAAPIIWRHPRRCAVRWPFKPAEVRRMPVPSCPSRAFAYDIACPACGCRNTWLVRAAGAPIEEGPLVEEVPPVADEADREDDPEARPFRRPEWLSSDREVRCAGCPRILRIRKSVVSAT